MCSFAATATGTIDVRGTVYNIDTVFHAKVGPGTTQTQLRLVSSSNALDVFYLTIDKTHPGVSIRSVCATDRVAGTARTSAMAASKTKPGVAYFAGVNADFFTTSGNATNGTSKVGSPTTSCTVDREIYKTSNSQYQFSVDLDGVARICRLNYYTGTATIGEKVTLFKGVNVASPSNGITIYTPRYWGSTNQTSYSGSCSEVTARLADDSAPFYAGGKFRLVVTGNPASDGDTTIPDDGYVIHGRGTSTTGCNTGALDFVSALKPGDVVEFDNIILTPDNERIYPATIVSGNPKNVGGGETLDTEGERGDASARHPRTNIGFSADGNTIIMMVIDGRSSSSVGVATSMSADIMRYAGAYESVNLDGGGSSTLYTQALGVRNNCSDGNERAVGNAVFAVLEAPEDDQIAEIAFADYVKRMPAFGKYTPVIYGYNKHGKLIDTDVKDFVLSSEAGDIVDDGHSLVAKNSGTFALYATCGDIRASIPVTVNTLTEVTPVYSSVLINSKRRWQVQLQSPVDRVMMPVAAESFDWTSDNTDVVTIDENGVVSGISEGTATVTGVNGDVVCSVKVEVQIPYGERIPVTFTSDSPWRTTLSSVKDVTMTPSERGFEIAYTMSSTRGPAINIYPEVVLYSLPEAVRMHLAPGHPAIKDISLYLKFNNQEREMYKKVTVSAASETDETQLVFKIDDYIDTSDIGIYPVTLYRIAITPSGKTSTPYTLPVTELSAQYDPATLGIDDPVADSNADNGGDCAPEYFTTQGVRVGSLNPAPGLYIVRRGPTAEKVLIK